LRQNKIHGMRWVWHQRIVSFDNLIQISSTGVSHSDKSTQSRVAERVILRSLFTRCPNHAYNDGKRKSPIPNREFSQKSDNTEDDVTVVGVVPPLAKVKSGVSSCCRQEGVVTEVVSKLVVYVNPLAGLYMRQGSPRTNMLHSCFTIVQLPCGSVEVKWKNCSKFAVSKLIIWYWDTCITPHHLITHSYGQQFTEESVKNLKCKDCTNAGSAK